MAHLERILSVVSELRRRLLRVLYVLAPLFGFLVTFQVRLVRVPFAGLGLPLAYPYPNLFDNVTAQTFRALVAWMLPAHVTLLNVGVGDSVVVQMEIAALLTVIVGMPWIVHEAGAFLMPALRSNERTLIRQVGIPASVLFALGTGLAFAFWTPLTFSLLFRYVSAMGLAPVLGVQDFITFALLYSLAFGILFELPVFLYALTRLRVVPAAYWRKHWRAAILGSLVFGMLITPDNSGITMLLIATPMIALYFAGAWFATRWEQAADPLRRHAAGA